jgi:hypothetical protein
VRRHREMGLDQTDVSRGEDGGSDERRVMYWVLSLRREYRTGGMLSK